jgi:SAM-dependent methyltransferase
LLIRKIGAVVDNKVNICPICQKYLQPISRVFTVEDLFTLWHPIRFSQTTFKEHCQQSAFTQLYACSLCNLNIFFPQIIGSPGFYQELQEGSGETYYEEDKWDFHEALKDARGRQSIIEIGCGPGIFLAKARSTVAQVFGTEYNDIALRKARNKGLQVLGMNDSYESYMGRFDAAFSFHVLEHVADPIAFIEEICSWIKPKGLIALSVPNQDGPIKYIDPCIMNMPPHHATRWSLRTFEILAQRMNLRIERVAYEPLLLQNHNYYSYYWTKHKFSGQTRFDYLISHLVSKLMYTCFETIRKGGLGYINFLKGQSMYIVMSKT